MKTVSILLGAALIIITGILLTLLKSGGALKPAGVIGATEMGSDQNRIPKALALRLFPEFHRSKNVIWYFDSNNGFHSGIPVNTYQEFQSPEKPVLVDLRENNPKVCDEGCWYFQDISTPLSESIQEKIQAEPSIEIFIDTFRRDAPVPQHCETEKILDNECVKHISVREIHRKLKSEELHFFMRRYLDSRFFLFIEEPS